MKEGAARRARKFPLRFAVPASVLLVLASAPAGSQPSPDTLITEYRYDESGNIVEEFNYFDRFPTLLEIQPSIFRRGTSVSATIRSRGTGDISDAEVVPTDSGIVVSNLQSSPIAVDFDLGIDVLTPEGEQTLSVSNHLGIGQVTVTIRKPLPFLVVNPVVPRTIAGQVLDLQAQLDGIDDIGHEFEIDLIGPDSIAASVGSFIVPAGSVSPLESIVIEGSGPGIGRLTIDSTFVSGPSRLVHVLPASVPAGEQVVVITTGESHTCALTGSGEISCWGLNNAGQAKPPDGEFVDITAGGNFTCALRLDGAIDCWGQNTDDLLVPPAGEYVQLSAGLWSHACALRDDGRAVCWGEDFSGQSSAPAGTFVEVTAGAAHSCGLHSDGSVSCWGDNSAGQSSPPAGQFIKVAAGKNQTCALDIVGAIQCWGSIGLPGAMPTSSEVIRLKVEGDPIPPGGDSPPEGAFTALDLGEYHGCGIRDDSRIVCWGLFSGGGQSDPTAQWTTMARWFAGDVTVTANLRFSQRAQWMLPRE
jgi:hypothetical protein